MSGDDNTSDFAKVSIAEEFGKQIDSAVAIYKRDPPSVGLKTSIGDSGTVADEVVSHTETTIGEGGTIAGLPMAMFIRGGGTPTMAHERAIAEAEADAEKRRDEALEERKLSRAPVEHGGGKIFENRSLDPGASEAYVLLDLVNSKGDPIIDHGVAVQCLADVRVLSADELALVVVCPRCVSRRIPQGQCQIQIRQKNRSWHLDTRQAGKPIFFDGKMFQSAGTVMDSERFGCSACGWTARIDNNKLRSE